MSHLETNPDGSISLVADGRLFSRAMVKDAAAVVVDRCHVTLDLEPGGAVRATFRAVEDSEVSLRDAVGHFGNLLVAALTRRHLDAQAQASRNLLLARALDGALPGRGHDEGPPLPGEAPDAE